MWLRSSRLPRYTNWLRMCFAASLLLVVSAPLLVFFLANGVALACCAAMLGMLTGRLLMFAIAELEPRF